MASRELGWDLEKVSDPVRGPIGRLSERAATDLIIVAAAESWAVQLADAVRRSAVTWSPDLDAALTELREKVLR